jgi:hypothetical protein
MKTVLFSTLLLPLASVLAADEVPVLVRMENFLVSPSTGPVAGVVVKNQLGTEYQGTLRIGFPEGWKVTPAQHQVSLKPGESKRLAFAIETGLDKEANAYPVTISVEGPADKVKVNQTALCASSPYFKPKIDGDLSDWRDSIPIRFGAVGKSVALRTYWNKKQFCLAVEVEEDALISLEKGSARTGPDALLLAIGPAETADGKPCRYEALIVSSDAVPGTGKCFLRERSAQPKPLAEEECPEAKVAVSRTGRITTYEIAIPLTRLNEFKPDAGREFRLGLLVQDADGDGLRDLGEVMSLWPERRNAKAWGTWEPIKVGEKPPYDGAFEFGFCSSIH